MFEVGFSVFTTAFLVVGLLLFMGLWFFYDWRDKQFYDRQRLRHVHHCVKCGHLYTSRHERGVEACPKCGFENASLRF